MHVLLVEPDYYTRYPPLGLLKLGSHHKARGDEVKLVRGLRGLGIYPDLIYVTSLFTYAWEPVHRAVRFYRAVFPRARVLLGGIYATLMPEHARLSGAEIYPGLFREVEGLLPDYSLVDAKASVGFTSRGCIMRCPFCAVSVLEPFRPEECSWPSLRHITYPGHRKVVLWDNNFLASPYWRDVLGELSERQLAVDFNQGLDCRLITEEVAEKLRGVKVYPVRLAYDTGAHRGPLRRAIDTLARAGFMKRKMVVYTMFNYAEGPEEFLDRVRDLLEWGVAAYPMCYEPIDVFDGEGNPLQKNVYVSPKWTRERLEMVARARRVIGYGGAFPPYDGLRKKFINAANFEDAFSLRERGASSEGKRPFRIGSDLGAELGGLESGEVGNPFPSFAEF